MMSAPTTRLLLVLAAFLAGLGTLFAILLLVVRPETAAMVPSAAAIGGPFRLIDQNGQAVTDRSRIWCSSASPTARTSARRP